MPPASSALATSAGAARRAARVLLSSRAAGRRHWCGRPLARHRVLARPHPKSTASSPRARPRATCRTAPPHAPRESIVRCAPPAVRPAAHPGVLRGRRAPLALPRRSPGCSSGILAAPRLDARLDVWIAARPGQSNLLGCGVVPIELEFFANLARLAPFELELRGLHVHPGDAHASRPLQAGSQTRLEPLQIRLLFR